MKYHLTKVVVFFVVMFYLISVMDADLLAQKKFEGYWESITNSKSTMAMVPKKDNEKEKSFYKSGKMKNVNLTENKSMIFRFDKGLTWDIDHNDKTYSEMTFEQMQEGMKNAKNQMAEAMKDMDPQQREMMKKMMGKKMDTMFGDSDTPMISFKNTSKKKTIAFNENFG